MEEKKTEIPFIVYEAEMTRAERTQRRLWITSLIMLGLLFGSNAAWIIRLFG